VKKLLIILLLLITSYSYGQAVLSGSKGWNGAYNLRAEQFFTRCVTAGITLTTAQKQWYSDSIFQPLQDSGLIGATRSGDSIQALWGFAKFMGDTTVLKLNLLSDSNTCVSVGTLTWTDSGAVGNGTSSYLNTNFNPTWDSTIFQMYSGSFGIYVLTDTLRQGAGSGIAQITPTRRTWIYPYYSEGNSTFGLVNTGIGAGIGPGILTSTRQFFSAITRSSAGSGVIINETYYSTSGNTGYKPDGFLYLQSVNGYWAYDKRVYSFAFIGSGLSSEKMRMLKNILNNSLLGRGYNVY
jgi:hypothetical protein